MSLEIGRKLAIAGLGRWASGHYYHGESLTAEDRAEIRAIYQRRIERAPAGTLLTGTTWEEYNAERKEWQGDA